MPSDDTGGADQLGILELAQELRRLWFSPCSRSISERQHCMYDGHCRATSQEGRRGQNIRMTLSDCPVPVWGGGQIEDSTLSELLSSQC